MWYYRARIYNPTLGRFMQTDPMGYKVGIICMPMSADDPMNLSDPSGNSPVAVPIVITEACLANLVCRTLLVNALRAAGREIVRQINPLIGPLFRTKMKG